MFNLSSFEQEAIAKLFLAAILGFIMAYDRRQQGKGAGMRTYGMISTGSCLFTLVSMYGFLGADPARIAAQVVTGIGFIGAGVIWKQGPEIVGITTAAGVWVAAAVGMSTAVGLYALAITTVILTIILFKARGVMPSS